MSYADYCCGGRAMAERDSIFIVYSPGSTAEDGGFTDAGFILVKDDVDIIFLAHCPWCGTQLDPSCDPAVGEPEEEDYAPSIVADTSYDVLVHEALGLFVGPPCPKLMHGDLVEDRGDRGVVLMDATGKACVQWLGADAYSDMVNIFTGELEFGGRAALVERGPDESTTLKRVDAARKVLAQFLEQER